MGGRRRYCAVQTHGARVGRCDEGVLGHNHDQQQPERWGVHKDKMVPVRVGMLAELHDRAEQPIVYPKLAQIFLWASGVFAGVSGVSLIVLSKRRRVIAPEGHRI